MERIGKSGNRRKSRRLRLNISLGSGAEQKFAPQGADWRLIEAAYGHPLTSADRDTIVGLVSQYFCWQPGEARAPFVDDAVDYLDRLEKAGKRFWDVLLEREGTPMTGSGDQAGIAEEDMMRSNAMGFVQSHVGRFLKQYEFRRQTDWRGLLDVMGACTAAMVQSRKYITEEAARIGFVEGRQWDQLIWKLTAFAEARALPSRISKSADPSQASAFVRFIRELQRTFPAQFRRHATSNAALAEAITVARRKIKRLIAQQEAQKINSPDQPT